MLVDLDDELLHVQRQGVGRLVKMGHVWVGDDEFEGPLDVHDGVQAGRLRNISFQSGDMDEVVNGYGVVAAELGQCPDARFLEAAFEVAEIGIGDTGIGFHLSERLGSAEGLEQLPNGRTVSGGFGGQICWAFGLGGGLAFRNAFFGDHFPTFLAWICCSVCYNGGGGHEPTTKKGETGAKLEPVYQMNEPTNRHDADHEVNNNIVLTDSDIAKFQQAREVFVKLLLKQRLAMFAEANAIGETVSGSEEPALEIWEEMPEVGKEFEAFDSDADAAV